MTEAFFSIVSEELLQQQQVEMVDMFRLRKLGLKLLHGRKVSVNLTLKMLTGMLFSALTVAISSRIKNTADCTWHYNGYC